MRQKRNGMFGILAMIAVFIFIFYGIVIVDNTIDLTRMDNFWDVPSIILTVGCTIATLLTGFPLSQFRRIPSHLKICFFQKSKSPEDIIDTICAYAKEARIKGLLALEEKLNEETDDFLKRGLMLVVDSIDAEKVNMVLEMEMDYLETRHYDNINFYKRAATYAPAYGMVGTLIGLIIMLRYLEDSEQIAPSMAIALVTTFYGSVLANAVFLPIADRLIIRHNDEMLEKQIIMEGVKAIQSGENPRFIEEKLMLMLNSKRRNRDEQKNKKTDKKVKMPKANKTKK